MEYAFYENEICIAKEIAKNFETESKIRKASKNKRLLCLDPNCENRILKYCHGEKKAAHFAHINNCSCEYEKFEGETVQSIHCVKEKLYQHFKAREFNVRINAKVYPHHFAHLLFVLPNDKKLALELITIKTNAEHLENLSKKYANANIEVKWMVVSDLHTKAPEDETYYAKRYLLNENNKKDIIILNEHATKITQYVIDPNKYLFNGHELSLENYPPIFSKVGTLNDLVLENNEFTIKNFHQEYEKWLLNKKKVFEKQKKELELEEQKEQERQEKREKERQEKIKQENADAYKRQNSFDEKASKEMRQNSLFSRQSPRYNPNVIKTKYCRICREIYPIEEFRNTFEDIGIYDFGECRYCIEFQEEQEKERTKLNSKNKTQPPRISPRRLEKKC